MRDRQTVASLSLFVCLTWAAPARAQDAVLFWNEVATTVITTQHANPAGLVDFAKVHLAIYDAVQAIERRYQPYHVEIPGASGSPQAAAAKAAHDVLVAIFPSQAGSLGTTYANYLSANGLQPTDAGVAVGAEAAAGILDLRANDGAFPSTFPGFSGGTAPGDWRPTLPAFATMAVPWLGFVQPFARKDSSDLVANPPHPDLKSGLYARDYNEVKALGGLTGSTRTPAQTDLAHFFSDNFISLWQRTLRAIAADEVDNIADRARLFAMTSTASADAAIGAWASKLFYNFWRPITAIQEGENDGNPRTTGQPGWLPLIATPPYPDYTSGANNLTASTCRSLQHFFGTDELTFSITTLAAAAIQKTRVYHRFSDVIQDVINVRIYQGIHFRFADEVAARTGKQSADWVHAHFFKPVGGSDR
jgi:hypothetical protein